MNPYHTEAGYMHPFTTHSEYVNHMMQTDGMFSNAREGMRHLTHAAKRAATAIKHPNRTAPYNPVQQNHDRDRNELLQKRAADKLEMDRLHNIEMKHLSHKKHINEIIAKNKRHAKKMSNNQEILDQMKEDHMNNRSQNSSNNNNTPMHEDLMDDDDDSVIYGQFADTIDESRHSRQGPRGSHSSAELASRNGRGTLPRRPNTRGDYHPRYNTMDMQSYAGDYHPRYNTMDMQSYAGDYHPRHNTMDMGSYAGDYHPRDTTTSMLPRLEYPHYERY
jgi:hypothetical protein